MPSQVEELEAVHEFQKLLQVASRPLQLKLLSSGYVPSSPDPLVEAGLGLLPILQDGSADEVSDAAFRRLEAVVTRLRLAPPASNPRALSELESRLGRYRKADRILNVVAAAVVMAVLGLSGWGLVTWLHH
jgi:hypothetical protein